MSISPCVRLAPSNTPQTTSLLGIGICSIISYASLSCPARPSKSTMHP
uniref:Uncharacterized protein n=1 Tax=Arundo donax TaxID=35708 RepID=A0A0A9EL97_ARUDO